MENCVDRPSLGTCRAHLKSHLPGAEARTRTVALPLARSDTYVIPGKLSLVSYKGGEIVETT
eukprot:279154-Prymnesium_polylepis.1